MSELKKATIYLQKASVSDFIFYDQEDKKTRHLKQGFNYWELKSGAFHFRSTPSYGTREELNSWIKENLTQQVTSEKLFVASGDPPKEEVPQHTYTIVSHFLDYTIKNNYVAMNRKQKKLIIDDYLKGECNYGD